MLLLHYAMLFGYSSMGPIQDLSRTIAVEGLLMLLLAGNGGCVLLQL